MRLRLLILNHRVTEGTEICCCCRKEAVSFQPSAFGRLQKTAQHLSNSRPPIAEMAEHFFAAKCSLTIGGGISPRYLPEGGLRRQKYPSVIAE
jgi:hypothetical protein